MLWAIVAVVLAMGSLSFASVPLYRIFCQMTGYDGTTQEGGTLPDKIVDRDIRILFDARVDSGLPWDFGPEQKHLTVKVGQQGFISYQAKNLAGGKTTGTAVYNVTPDKVGKYFHKTQCFCFAEQSIAPGKIAHFPVVFFVDPSIMDDPTLDDVTDITLSYTFFATESDALDKALSDYGQ